jgi:hypothetical protein
LEVTDGLTASSNDEANSAIGNHDFQAVLADGRITGRRSILRRPVAGPTALRALHVVFFNDAEDFVLGLTPGARVSGNAALARGSSVVRGRDELDAGGGLLLDAAQVLTAAANHQAYKVGVNADDLGAVIVTTWRPVTASTLRRRREVAAAAWGPRAVSVSATPVITTVIV